MPSQRVHSSEGTALIAAPAGVVYGMLADAVRWPLLLPSPVHVERIDFDGVRERLRLWEWEGEGERVRSFHVRRVLDPHARTVAFEQEDAARPGLLTAGTWTVEESGTARCQVTIRQERTVEHLPAAASARSRREWETEPRVRLAHLAAAAERWERLDELLLSFEDSAYVAGPAELVYDFLHRVGDWPQRLPHVESAVVVEDLPGVQLAEVETAATADAGASVTRAVRLCFPAAARIVFKALAAPGPIAAHTGAWSLVPEEDGVRVVCAQQVVLDEGAARRAPGAGAGLAGVRRSLRTRLGRESTETLRLAGWRARTAVRRLR